MEDINDREKLVIRTVLGDIEPGALGPTDYHEHLFQVSPLLQGDELEDETRSGAEARSLHLAGVKAMIEATPLGLGRNVEACARISAATGLSIVHITGAHHGGHYPQDHPIRAASAGDLASRFIRDICEGFSHDNGTHSLTASGHRIRAGMLKAGIRYWAIGAFESMVLEAVAAAHRATGAAVMIHLDYGSATHEVLDRLSDLGVSAQSVVLAHIDRNLDPGLHASLAARGAYLGYDGMARHKQAPDAAIIACLKATIEADGLDRLVLGGDVARSTRYLAYGGMPGLEYLPKRFLPRLRDEVGEDAVNCLMDANPARLLAMPQGRLE